MNTVKASTKPVSYTHLSTPQWRLEALRQHFTILQEVFTDKAIQLMYVDEAEFDYFDKKRGITFWSSDELNMSAHLYYEPGQRKEGFLTVMLLLEDKGVYLSLIHI